MAGLLGRRDALASRRPSVARSAWSNGGDWKGGDHAARAPAAYWQTGRNSLGVLAEECPVAPLCGRRRDAGWLCLHNSVPGTSRWALFFRVLLRFWVEQAPGDGSDVVEELEGFIGSRTFDRACAHEETEMGVDLFCRTVGDSPVVHSVST